MSEDDGKNERSLSEAERKKLKPILDYLESHDTITPLEARKLTGKSSATVRRYMTLLCNSNLLEPTGKTSATIYKVIR
jgi:ATP-dependent DNA helicase RecG